jgi:hypothetical protein
MLIIPQLTAFHIFFSVGSFVYLQLPRAAISYTSKKYVINFLYGMLTDLFFIYDLFNDAVSSSD